MRKCQQRISIRLDLKMDNKVTYLMSHWNHKTVHVVFVLDLYHNQYRSYDKSQVPGGACNATDVR